MRVKNDPKRFDSWRYLIHHSFATNDTRSKSKRVAEPFYRFLSHVSTRSVLRPRACKFRVSAGGYVLEQPEDGLSFCYINAAYKIPCKTGLQKFVLITLANHANEHGVAWPSLNTIARECCMGRSSVIRHTSALEKMRLICIDRKHEHVNRYRLIFEPIDSPTVKPPGVTVTPGSIKVTPKPSTNHQREPSTWGIPPILEAEKRGRKPQLFAKEIKESFKAKRELIKNDSSSYDVRRYRNGNGEIKSALGDLKPESVAAMKRLDREERKHLAALID